MARLSGLVSSFERLSTREKGLIIGMVTLAFGVVIFFVWLWVSSSLDAIEEDIQDGKKALAEIHALADDYLGGARKKEAIQELINTNPIESLRIPVNTIAQDITLDSDAGEEGVARGRRLTALIDYGGKTVETRIEPKNRKGRRSRRRKTQQDVGANYEIEQSVEFRDIPIPTLYKFLEALKQYDGLLFIRRMEITRRFRDLDHAGATVTVSTIKFREPESM